MPAERQPASGLLSDRYALGFLGLGGTAVAGFTAGTALGPIAGLAFGGVTALLFFILWDNARWAAASARSPDRLSESPGRAALRALSARAFQIVTESVHDVGAVRAPAPSGFGLSGFPQDIRHVERPATMRRLPGIRIVDASGSVTAGLHGSVFPTAPRPSTVDGGSSTVEAIWLNPSWSELGGSETGSSTAQPVTQISLFGHDSTPPVPAIEIPERPRSMVPNG
jgi:hypothetical protein